jgi:hypothetical protein
MVIQNNIYGLDDTDPVTILHKNPLLRRFIYCEIWGEFIGSINIMYYGMGKQLPIMLGKPSWQAHYINIGVMNDWDMPIIIFYIGRLCNDMQVI